MSGMMMRVRAMQWRSVFIRLENSTWEVFIIFPLCVMLIHLDDAD